ncbi:hypothetical protein M0804_013468 [Polistes exclamans]|nr:hypothetical protein M0804_013468 [Polistes exclamans]
MDIEMEIENGMIRNGKKKEGIKENTKLWRKKKIQSEYYINKKREYRNWYEAKRKRFESLEEEKLKNVAGESEVWKYINRFRKKRREEVRQKETRSEEASQHIEDQEELSREEFVRQVNRLKRGKAPREDKLENEIWKYMPKEGA